MNSFVIADGQPIAVNLPCMLEEFLVAQKLLARGLVAEYALARAEGRS